MIEGSPPLFLGEVAHSARGVYINFDTALFSSEIVSIIVVSGIALMTQTYFSLFPLFLLRFCGNLFFY
jgi:hypothetical protein